MLILTRRVGESVVVGDNEITITVLGVKGNQTRIGIATKLDVSLHREEIYLNIKEQKEPIKTLVDAIRKLLAA